MQNYHWANQSENFFVSARSVNKVKIFNFQSCISISHHLSYTNDKCGWAIQNWCSLYISLFISFMRPVLYKETWYYWIANSLRIFGHHTVHICHFFGLLASAPSQATWNMRHSSFLEASKKPLPHTDYNHFITVFTKWDAHPSRKRVSKQLSFCQWPAFFTVRRCVR